MPDPRRWPTATNSCSSGTRPSPICTGSDVSWDERKTLLVCQGTASSESLAMNRVGVGYASADILRFQIWVVGGDVFGPPSAIDAVAKRLDLSFPVADAPMVPLGFGTLPENLGSMFTNALLQGADLLPQLLLHPRAACASLLIPPPATSKARLPKEISPGAPAQDQGPERS